MSLLGDKALTLGLDTLQSEFHLTQRLFSAHTLPPALPAMATLTVRLLVARHRGCPGNIAGRAFRVSGQACRTKRGAREAKGT